MGMDNGVRFDGLDHELIYNPRAFENFELFLNASGSESSFVLEWSYNTQLFRPETIGKLMEAYTRVLNTLVHNPACRIGDIPVFPRPHIPLTGPETPFPKESTVTELFAAQVRATPARTALIFEDLHYTYRQLDESSSRLAHFLRSKGVGPETMVPLCIRRSSALIISILGILKAGGAYVPIDPGYPLERIRLMLDDISAGFLLADRSSAAVLPSGTDCETLIFEELSLAGPTPVDPPIAGATAASLAYVMYTSGSTGRPKGAMIMHSNITSLVKASDYVAFDGTEVILSTGSPSFDAITFEYWGPLLNGGTLVLPSEETLLDTNLLKHAIRNHKVSMMWITSSLLNQWVNLDIGILKGLKTILAGGEKLSERHIGLLRKAYPHLVIINGYGPTENTTFSLTYTMSGGDPIPMPIPIGRPLSNRSAYILDAKGRLCRPGEAGELFVGGAGVGRGYLKRPELTAERFLPDPFNSEPGSKMYRTGDLARWLPDGNIEYLGRIDDQVKIRGHRIELGEIESNLGQCPGVKDAVVIAHEDKKG
jgi:amino acid adenylation domain-containing protein